MPWVADWLALWILPNPDNYSMFVSNYINFNYVLKFDDIVEYANRERK